MGGIQVSSQRVGEWRVKIANNQLRRIMLLARILMTTLQMTRNKSSNKELKAANISCHMKPRIEPPPPPLKVLPRAATVVAALK